MPDDPVASGPPSPPGQPQAYPYQGYPTPLDPTQGYPTQGYPPFMYGSSVYASNGQWPPAPSPQRRRRGRPLVIIILILVLVGATTTAVLSFLRSPDPGQVTRSYFAALARGDAAKALSYGAPPSRDAHLLTAPVLRMQLHVAPLRSFAVTAVNEAGDRAVVDVRYVLAAPGGAKSVAASVALVRRSRRWRLSATAALVRVNVASAARRAIVGGTILPAEPVLIFPGAAPVEYDSPLLQQAARSEVVGLNATGTVSVYAGLTPAAKGVLSDAAKAAMTQCLSAGATAKAGCPLAPDGTRAVPGSLRGTVLGVRLGGDPSLDAASQDGLVDISGTLSVNGTWTALDFDNLPVAKAGSASITFSAHAYVTRPNVVRFQVTP